MAEINRRGTTLQVGPGIIAAIEPCGHSFKARKEDIEILASWAEMDQEEMAAYQIHCPVCAQLQQQREQGKCVDCNRKAVICSTCHDRFMRAVKNIEWERVEKLQMAAEGIFSCYPRPIGFSVIENGKRFGEFTITGNRLDALEAALAELEAANG